MSCRDRGLEKQLQSSSRQDSALFQVQCHDVISMPSSAKSTTRAPSSLMARVPRLGAECLYPCNCKKPVHTISILMSIAINYGIFLKFLTPANCDRNIINIHVALGRNIGTQVVQGPNSMTKGRDLSHAEGYIYIYIYMGYIWDI